MADLCEGIGLVHELRELATAEKFLHSGNDRTNIDQCVRCCLAWLLDTHALLYDTLHTQEADTELRLDQLSNAAHAAVAKMIDVVFAAVPVVQGDQATNDIDQVVLGQDALTLRSGEIKLSIELIATDATKIIATRVKKEIFNERTGIVDSSGIAGAQFFIEFE